MGATVITPPTEGEHQEADVEETWSDLFIRSESQTQRPRVFSERNIAARINNMETFQDFYERIYNLAAPHDQITMVTGQSRRDLTENVLQRT